MKHKHRVAVSTTLFPMPKAFVDDFFSSLNSQTEKQFDVVVLNDGFDSLQHYIEQYPELNIIELSYCGSIAKNREYSINFIIEQKYEIVIFADSDDYFDRNRVALTLELLQCNDILVNDVNLFNKQGIYDRNYISNRFSEGVKLSITDILDKNIFGLSNTAVKVSCLSRVCFDPDLIAVDWYFFSSLMLESQTKAIFSSQTQTYYRQHTDNTVGMAMLTKSSFSHGLKVKLQHYSLMIDLDERYKPLLNRIMHLKDIEVNEDLINQLNNSIGHPLWWELIGFEAD